MKKKMDLDEQIFWLIVAFAMSLGIVTLFYVLISLMWTIIQEFGGLGLFGLFLVGGGTFIIWRYFVNVLSD
jgi:hypothetical protein